MRLLISKIIFRYGGTFIGEFQYSENRLYAIVPLHLIYIISHKAVRLCLISRISRSQDCLSHFLLCSLYFHIHRQIYAEDKI